MYYKIEQQIDVLDVGRKWLILWIKHTNEVFSFEFRINCIYTYGTQPVSLPPTRQIRIAINHGILACIHIYAPEIVLIIPDM